MMYSMVIGVRLLLHHRHQLSQVYLIVYEQKKTAYKLEIFMTVSFTVY